MERSSIEIRGAHEHNLKHIDLSIPRQKITVVTGVSGSGKSSLAFDTVLAEANRRFFYTLSHYSRQFLDLGSRPALRSASGLSPAISLAQNETQASVRASVASLSDIGEMLGVLFARFAEKRCPTHDLPTEARSLDEIVAFAKSQYYGRTIAITVIVADQKKGQFKKQLEGFAKKGYAKAFIDGKLLDIEPVPNLAKEEKHDIALVIDSLKVDAAKETRLRRSVETALSVGEGLACIYTVDSKGGVDERAGQHLSLQAGCPVCHYAWPRLDSRHFSANSLGRCEDCDGRGVIIADDDEKAEEGIEPEPCRTCQGTGLNPKLKSITFRGRSILKFYLSTLKDLHDFTVESLDSTLGQTPAVKLVLGNLLNHSQRMMEIGLGYIHLGRRIRSLSNGEAQRLRLSAILNEQLRGVLYVLDEPSQGLHPREIDRLWAAIERLKAQGNTVIVVDHDPDMMRRADWIIDLGPGGGAGGGMLLAQFDPKESKSYAKVSATAEHLHHHMKERTVSTAPRKSFKEFITLQKPRLNNLKMDRVRFPLAALTVVSGVSGAGKSSLVLKTLYYNLKGAKNWRVQSIKGGEETEFCTLISRKPIAKSSVSMPATYLDVFTDLRNLFASLPEAQIYGLSASSFSFSNEEGRCPECKGRGTLTLSMRFLADAEILCPVCQGKRYKPHLLDVRYGGLNLSEVLELSVAEAYERFKNFRAIERKLAPALALGLGYLKLGQPSSSLSGGESQRLKLVPYLSKRVQPGTVLIMDEPTVGLHFKDVRLLLEQLHKLVEQGVTMVVIEHDQQVIDSAEWLIELGPESGDEGGQLLYEGPPAEAPMDLRV
ncbi:MAG: excinuclease ABC subunit UvrA [Bdellovibrionota bacterium]